MGYIIFGEAVFHDFFLYFPFLFMFLIVNKDKIQNYEIYQSEICKASKFLRIVSTSNIILPEG